MNNIIETIKQNDLLKIALIGLAVYVYFTYMKKETLDNQEAEAEYVPQIATQTTEPDVIGAAFQSKPQLAADDLLPKYDESNDFAKQNPVSNLLKEQNFLIGGYHTGISTVISSQKQAYHDLRSCPSIPKDTSLSVWNISSYDEPVGSGRRQLEIV